MPTAAVEDGFSYDPYSDAANVDSDVVFNTNNHDDGVEGDNDDGGDERDSIHHYDYNINRNNVNGHAAPDAYGNDYNHDPYGHDEQEQGHAGDAGDATVEDEDEYDYEQAAIAAVAANAEAADAADAEAEAMADAMILQRAIATQRHSPVRVNDYNKNGDDYDQYDGVDADNYNGEDENEEYYPPGMTATSGNIADASAFRVRFAESAHAGVDNINDVSGDYNDDDYGSDEHGHGQYYAADGRQYNTQQEQWEHEEAAALAAQSHTAIDSSNGGFNSVYDDAEHSHSYLYDPAAHSMHAAAQPHLNSSSLATGNAHVTAQQQPQQHQQHTAVGAGLS